MGIRKPDEIIGLQGMREGRGDGRGAYDGPAPHWEEAATHLTVSGYRTDRNRDWLWKS